MDNPTDPERTTCADCARPIAQHNFEAQDGTHCAHWSDGFRDSCRLRTIAALRSQLATSEQARGEAERNVRALDDRVAEKIGQINWWARESKQHQARAEHAESALAASEQARGEAEARVKEVEDTFEAYEDELDRLHGIIATDQATLTAAQQRIEELKRISWVWFSIIQDVMQLVRQGKEAGAVGVSMELLLKALSPPPQPPAARAEPTSAPPCPYCHARHVPNCGPEPEPFELDSPAQPGAPTDYAPGHATHRTGNPDRGSAAAGNGATPEPSVSSPAADGTPEAAGVGAPSAGTSDKGE